MHSVKCVADKQKACALLQGLESGSTGSAMVSCANLAAANRQKRNIKAGAVPKGQRTIPKFERKLRVADSAVEGVERGFSRVEISAE